MANILTRFGKLNGFLMIWITISTFIQVDRYMYKAKVRKLSTSLLLVSEDCRVTHWTLIRSTMDWVDKMVINFSKPLQNINLEKLKHTGFGGGIQRLEVWFKTLISASGRTLAFKPDDETLYLVGTESGIIHLCTTEFSSKYIRTFMAHTAPVYAVQWNTFQPSVFISCAAEWNIKIWDMNHLSPLYIFDVQSPAGDVAWSTYSRLGCIFKLWPT